MNPLTREWIEKAEGDFHTAGRELRARKNPNYEAACFHAQQCAEKYLKAILQEQSITLGRTHTVLFMGEPALFSVYERGIREDLLKFSLIIVASVPVLRIYPFVQKYFARGVMIGSIKG